MKFFFDVGISSRIPRAIRVLEADHPDVQIIVGEERFRANTPDPDWLGALATEKDCVVLSTDSRIRTSPDERKAWLESGLTAYFFSPKFSREKAWPQIEEVIRWWQHIVLHAKRAPKGSAWSLPWGEKKPRQLEV